MHSAPSSRFSIRPITPLVVAFLFILITAVSLQAAPVSSASPIGSRLSSSHSASADIWIGWFTVIWADGKPGTHLGFEEYWLAADDGKMTRLQIDPALLQSARGLGALLGALTIAALGRFKWKGRLLTIETFFFPVVLIVFAVITWPPLSLLALVAVGWGFLITANMAGTLLQTLVPEEFRGRMTGVYSLVAFGFLPIGALAAGAAADWIGAPLTVILGAIAWFLFAIGLYIFVPRLRSVE